MAWLLPLILWLILFGLTRFVYQRGRLKITLASGRGRVGAAGAGRAGLLLAGGGRTKLDAGGRRRSGLVPLSDLPVCGGSPASRFVAALEPGALRRRAAHRRHPGRVPLSAEPAAVSAEAGLPLCCAAMAEHRPRLVCGRGDVPAAGARVASAPRGRADRRTGVHVLRRLPDALRQPELQRGGELAAVGVLGVCWKLEAGSWKPVVTRYESTRCAHWLAWRWPVCSLVSRRLPGTSRRRCSS